MVVSKKSSTFAQSNKNKQQFKTITIMKTNSIKIANLILGARYRFSGDIQNGSYTTHDEVVRKLTYITNDYLILECGRRFIINKNLVISEC